MHLFKSILTKFVCSSGKLMDQTRNRVPMVYLSKTRITATLIYSVVFLQLANIPAVWIRYGSDQSVLARLYMSLFSVSSEGKIPTWYSACTLLFCALLLFTITLIKRHNQGQYISYWLILGVVFLLMSLDEATQIHEMANRPLHKAYNTSGIFLFAWVIPGIIFVISFTLCYLRFLFSLPQKTRVLFLIAGSIYVSGVLGMELVGSHYVSHHGRDLTYGIIASIEEVFEMSGIVIFVYGLLDYLEKYNQPLKISFGPAKF